MVDEDLIALVCDHCGDETHAKVGTLRRNQTVACLACGVPLECTATEFTQDGARGQSESGDARKILS